MKTRKEIIRDIVISAETNCVLKLKIKGTPNPVITSVEKVEKKEIVLKPTCLYGYKLMKRTITLFEIESVTRYRTYFHHPIFERIRYIKNNLPDIRRNIGSSDGSSPAILEGN